MGEGSRRAHFKPTLRSVGADERTCEGGEGVVDVEPPIVTSSEATKAEDPSEHTFGRLAIHWFPPNTWHELCYKVTEMIFLMESTDAIGAARYCGVTRSKAIRDV